MSAERPEEDWPFAIPQDWEEPSELPLRMRLRPELMRAIEKRTDPTLALVNACTDKFERCSENITEASREGVEKQFWNFSIEHPDATQQSYDGFLCRRKPSHTEDVSSDLIIAFSGVDLAPHGKAQIEYRLVGAKGKQKWLRHIFVDNGEDHGKDITAEQLKRILRCMDHARPGTETPQAPDTLDV